MNSFDLYSSYYDLLYADKDTEGECTYIEGMLHKCGPVGKHILELGAGSGRHGQVFLKKGFDWKGLELSESMAALGRTKGLDIEQADIRNFDLYPARFDIILGLFHVISYLTTNHDVKSCFDCVASHLNSSGLFLFDFWYTPAVSAQRPEMRERLVEDELIEVKRVATPTVDWMRNTVNVRYSIKVREKATSALNTFSEDHLMRHFSIPEVRLLAESAGLEFLHAGEWMTGNPPGPNTWGVCCILKKN